MLWKALHVNNVDVFNSFNPKNNNDLIKKIMLKIKDPLLKVPNEWSEFDNKKLSMINGVRVDVTNYVKENSLYLPCFRPNISPGFFMFNHNSKVNNKPEIKRFYIGSTSPEYAIDIWSDATNQLVKKNIDFQSKVLSNSKLYPRTDAVVFYIFKQDVNLVQNILVELIEEKHEDFACSKLAKKLLYNLAIADEPINLNAGVKQSFGENRCEIIADSIFDHLNKGIDFQLILKERLLSSMINPYSISDNLH